MKDAYTPEEIRAMVKGMANLTIANLTAEVAQLRTVHHANKLLAEELAQVKAERDKLENRVSKLDADKMKKYFCFINGTEYNLRMYTRELGWTSLDYTYFALMWKGYIVDEEGKIIQDFTGLPFLK